MVAKWCNGMIETNKGFRCQPSRRQKDGRSNRKNIL